MHFLNVVPIRTLHDRYVSENTEPWSATLVDSRTWSSTTARSTPWTKESFETYIRTNPERLWEAITDSAIRSTYQFGNRDHRRSVGSRDEIKNLPARSLPVSER